MTMVHGTSCLYLMERRLLVPDGFVARLKACLVAKGYAQTYSVDYSNIFSPVAKLTSVCLFISLAASYVYFSYD